MHLAFVVNTDFFFLSHRLPLAKAAQARGWRVTVIAPPTGREDEIRREGLAFVPLPLSRSGMNPVEEARTLRFLYRTYRDLRPDLVHHVTSKPVVYGSLAARLLPQVAVVNAVSGLGYMFIGKGRFHPTRLLMLTLYRLALHHPRSVTIFQNRDDLSGFVGRKLVSADRTALIRGCGVNGAAFAPAEEPPGPPVVMFPARLLEDKGALEFVEAARRLKRGGRDARFVLVGMTDEGNPAGVPTAQVRAWEREGLAEWWGYQTDMPATLAKSSLVVLPSYREGLPKVLLEAAATQRAIVTTDVPGCREVVEEDANGLLVPPRDADALTEAVGRLLQRPDLRRQYAQEGRRRAENEFSEAHFVEQSMAVYDRALALRQQPPR